MAIKLKKQQKTFLGIIALLIVFFAFGNYITSGQLLAVAGGGATTLAVSEVSLSTNNQELGADAILATFAVNQGAEGGIAYSNDVNELAGVKSEPYSIHLDLVEQSCNYKIVNTSEEVIYVSGMLPGMDSFVNSQLPQGTSAEPFDARICPGYNKYWKRSGNRWATLCINKNPAYKAAQIDESVIDLNYKVRISIEKDGETIEGFIDPKTSVVDLKDSQGNFIARAKWAGNLLGTQMCGPQISAGFMRSINENTYKLVNKFTLLSAQSQSQTFSPGGLGSYDGAISQGNALNSIVNSLWNSGTGEYTVNYKVEPTQQIVIPIVQMLIKADEFAVFVPSSQPKILNVQVDPIIEGVKTLYPVQIQNQGNETDSFEVRVECPTPVTVAANRISLNPGEVGTVDLEVVGMKSTQTCIVSVNSLNDPDLRDEIQATFKIVLPECPFDCCEGLATYRDKACPESFEINGTLFTYTCEVTRCISDEAISCVGDFQCPDEMFCREGFCEDKLIEEVEELEKELEEGVGVLFPPVVEDKIDEEVVFPVAPIRIEDKFLGVPVGLYLLVILGGVIYFVLTRRKKKG